MTTESTENGRGYQGGMNPKIFPQTKEISSLPFFTNPLPLFFFFSVPSVFLRVKRFARLRSVVNPSCFPVVNLLLRQCECSTV